MHETTQIDENITFTSKNHQILELFHAWIFFSRFVNYAFEHMKMHKN